MDGLNDSQMCDDSGEEHTTDFNSALINSIKKFPSIFAKSTKEFRNSVRKDAAWRCVAKEMSMPEDTARRKWKHLRDRFVKEHREVTKTTTSGAGVEEVHKCNWPLYEELLFLASHCKSRPTTGNYHHPERQKGTPPALAAHVAAAREPVAPTPAVSGYSSSASEEVIEEVLLDESEWNDSQLISGKTKKRKLDIDDRIHAILDEVQHNIVPESNKNRHASFGMYLVDRMQLLPLNVARELEVEFTGRVNCLLDLYAD